MTQGEGFSTRCTFPAAREWGAATRSVDSAIAPVSGSAGWSVLATRQCKDCPQGHSQNSRLKPSSVCLLCPQRISVITIVSIGPASRTSFVTGPMEGFCLPEANTLRKDLNSSWCEAENRNTCVWGYAYTCMPVCRDQGPVSAIVPQLFSTYFFNCLFIVHSIIYGWVRVSHSQGWLASVTPSSPPRTGIIWTHHEAHLCVCWALRLEFKALCSQDEHFTYWPPHPKSHLFAMRRVGERWKTQCSKRKCQLSLVILKWLLTLNKIQYLHIAGYVYGERESKFWDTLGHWWSVKAGC